MGALAGIAIITLIVGVLAGAWLVALHDERAEVTGGVRDVSPPPVAVNEPDVPRPVRWPHPAGSVHPRHPDDAA